VRIAAVCHGPDINLLINAQSVRRAIVLRVTARLARLGAVVLCGAALLATPVHATEAVRGPVPMSSIEPLERPAVWIPKRGGQPEPWPKAWTKPGMVRPTGSGPLNGLVIAVDPGHHSGGFNHLREINTKYWVGLRKICNTTGTASTRLRESVYTWDVSRRLAKKLAAQGATVLLTRSDDAPNRYGPCIGARGMFGNAEGADFKISVHADGNIGGGRGFHIIHPGGLKGYTDDITPASRRLANDMVRAFEAQGFPRAAYLRSPLSARNDQGTLNMSDIPTIIVETLNMRNRVDARIAESATGRQSVADALADGAVRFAGRLKKN